MVTNTPTRLKNFQDLAPQARRHVADNMKERVYATITLLAVITPLWKDADRHTHWGAAGDIGGAVVALWLATLVATRLSHRAVHGRHMNMREYRAAAFSASGLLVPAVAPLLLIGLSATGLFGLATALYGSIIVLLVSLMLISFIASRRMYQNPWQILAISGFEMLIGAGVIWLKLLLD
jgi:small-conductance mechanosensitive channel